MNLNLVKQLKGIIASKEPSLYVTNIVTLYLKEHQLDLSISRFYENDYLISCFCVWFLEETKLILKEDVYNKLLYNIIIRSILLKKGGFIDNKYENLNLIINYVARETISIKILPQSTI